MLRLQSEFPSNLIRKESLTCLPRLESFKRDEAVGTGETRDKPWWNDMLCIGSRYFPASYVKLQTVKVEVHITRHISKALQIGITITNLIFTIILI